MASKGRSLMRTITTYPWSLSSDCRFQIYGSGQGLGLAGTLKLPGNFGRVRAGPLDRLLRLVCDPGALRGMHPRDWVCDEKVTEKRCALRGVFF